MRSWRYYLKWAAWVVLVQVVLINISAAIYAWKFTHFNEPPAPVYKESSIFSRTWKLFAGPDFYKNTNEPLPSFPVEIVKIPFSGGVLDSWYGKTDSARACVIFFHGLMANKSFLSDEASFFRSRGYNVLLVDFRGHGLSSGNSSSFGVKETEEVEMAEAWARRAGNNRIILYGVSLGAGVCIRAVAEGKVKPVAVIADMPFGKLRNHLRARAAEIGFPAEPFATLTSFWMGVEQGYNGVGQNMTQQAAKINVPILVEWGQKDRYVSRKEINELYSVIPSLHKKIVVYPDADHQSYLGIDPNRWKAEMDAFMKLNVER